MNKLLKLLMLLGVVTIACLTMRGSASAANNPFTCSSNFYQVFTNQLRLLDPLTGNYTDIGTTAPFDYNAIGYNVLDNYIYGIQHSGPQTGDLVRIGSDGTFTDLGLPAGLPVSGYINGSMDLAGNLYIRGDVSTIYKINISSMTTTTLTTSGDAIVAGADNVIIGSNLYTLVGTNLSVVDLNTNNVTTGTVNGPSGWLGAGNGFGAGWTDRAGELFFSNNGSGSIYQITNFNSPTPTATFKVAGTVTSNNDGTSCPLALQNPFDPPIAVNDSYTTLFNTPLSETITPVLTNDTGNTLTVTGHTNPAHGSVTLNADGTFLYTPNTGFSGTDSFDYTITDSFGRTATATVTITVTSTATPTAPATGYGKPPTVNIWTIVGIFTLSLTLLALGLRKHPTSRL
jgi:hypothetical protein